MVAHVAKRILSVVCKPFWLPAIICGRVTIKGTFLQPHCCITNKGRNHIKLDNSFFLKSSISVIGEGNTILSEGVVYNSSINVTGNHNVVHFAAGVRLYNSKILVNANNSHVFIDESTSIGGMNMVSMGGGNSISIGKNCMIAENVEIWNSDTHDICDNETGAVVNPPAPVSIGNHVWLCKNSMILKGALIGDGSVIGMSAIITGIVPKNSIAVGPGRIIKTNIKWDHNWSEAQIRRDET